MRLDVWLKKTCLLKSRSQAKQGCQSGKILLDGERVKESHQLKADERITLHFPQREVELKVLDIPTGNVAKKDAQRYYEIIREEGTGDLSL